jgi:hypothetical protein
MKTIIEDCIYVMGRGTVVVVKLPDELLEYVGDFTYVSKVKASDKVKIDSKEYVVKGVEKLSTSKFVGLIIGGEDVDNIDNFFGKEIEI